MTSKLAKLAEELYIVANTNAGLFLRWELCPKATVDIWMRESTHVQRLILEARIEELKNHYKDYHNYLAPGTMSLKEHRTIENRIYELTTQLKDLKGGAERI